MIKKITLGVLISILFLVIIYFGISFFVVYQLLHTDHSCGYSEGFLPNDYNPGWNVKKFTKNSRTQKVLKNFPAEKYTIQKWETVSFPSRDKKATIKAWYSKNSLKKNPKNRTIIVVHGISPSGKCNFLNLIASALLFQRNFSVLNIDLRNYGESTITSDYIKLGAKEYLDILGAYDFLVEQGIPKNKIGVMGISLGATTSIYALAKEKNLKAAWLDSSYAKLSLAIKDELERKNLPNIFGPALNVAGKLLAGITLSELNPIDNFNNTEQNFFFTHGEKDPRMYIKHFKIFQQYFKKKRVKGKFWEVLGVGHIGALVEYPDEYGNRMAQFFNDSLK